MAEFISLWPFQPGRRWPLNAELPESTLSSFSSAWPPGSRRTLSLAAWAGARCQRCRSGGACQRKLSRPLIRGSRFCRPEGQVTAWPGGEEPSKAYQDWTPNLSPPRAVHHHSKPPSLHLKMETPRPTSHGPEADTSITSGGPGPAQVPLRFGITVLSSRGRTGLCIIGPTLSSPDFLVKSCHLIFYFVF